jgi:acetylornithine deacetylase/succinyl-diaminopimelate desuccinylase-like protein
MDAGLQARVKERLIGRRAEQFRFLADLVKDPSENPPGDGAPHAARLADRLKRIGLAAERHPVPLDMCRARGVASVTNLVVRHEFGPGPVIALNVHLDTVPAGRGWSMEPYGAQVERGVMYGRGVAVSKASLAAYAYALLALRTLQAPFAGTIEIHITYDREAGGYLGVPWLIEKGITNPDYAISAGGSYGIVTMHNGVLHLEVQVRGRAGHPAFPEASRDALAGAHAVIGALYALREQYAKARRKIRGLASPSITVGTIHGGHHPDSVADTVTLGVARRLLPDEDPVAVEQEISAYIGKAVLALDGIVCRIRRTGIVEPLKPIPGTEKLVRVLSKNGNKIMGERVISHGLPYSSDARHYVAVGIPTVIYGAGPKNPKQANAYQADEHLKLDDLRKSTEVLALALGEFMSPP